MILSLICAAFCAGLAVVAGLHGHVLEAAWWTTLAVLCFGYGLRPCRGDR